MAEAVGASGDASEQAQAVTDPAERRARDATLRARFADPTSRHHEAIATAELNVDYAGSPIVMGDAHDALGPGQRLPDTIEVQLAGGGDRMLHELTNRAGHTALLIGRMSARGEVLARLDGSLRAGSGASLIEATVVLTTRADDLNPYGRLAPAAADRLGIGESTLLVIRPDGHVGLRANRDHIAALAAYHALLVSGRT